MDPEPPKRNASPRVRSVKAKFGIHKFRRATVALARLVPRAWGVRGTLARAPVAAGPFMLRSLWPC
jgi:hypothetical protein